MSSARVQVHSCRNGFRSHRLLRVNKPFINSLFSLGGKLSLIQIINKIDNYKSETSIIINYSQLVALLIFIDALTNFY